MPNLDLWFRLGAWMSRSRSRRNLVLRPREGRGEKVYWDAQWRFRTEASRPWRMKKQRLGLARLEPDGSGGWRKRKGRCRDSWLDERAAHLAADRAMKEHAAALRSARDRARREQERQLTVPRPLEAQDHRPLRKRQAPTRGLRALEPGVRRRVARARC